MSLVTGFERAATALTLAGGVGWLGWSVSRLFLRDARALVRWGGALVGSAAIVFLLTHALLAVGMFRLPAVLAVLAVAGVGAWSVLAARGVRPAPEIEKDVRSLARGLTNAGVVWRVALAAAFALAMARVVRALPLPALGWDALVYHLFRAGRWVGSGTSHVERAPGAWGFYEWFPSAGDTVWAWAFLGARDGAWLPVAGGVVWAVACFSAGFLAHRLGSSREGSIALAVVTGTMPAVSGAITACYVDTALLAMFLLGAAFLVGLRREGQGVAGEAWMAGTALGLAGAIKISLLPAVPIAALVLLFRRDRCRTCAALLAGALPVLGVEYGRAWWETGSPFWPFSFSFLGIPIVAGDDELAKQFSGAYAQDVIARSSPFAFLRWLFLWARFPVSDFAGFGPMSAPLFLVGLAALPRAAVRAGRGFLAAVLTVVVLVVATMSPENAAHRTVWVGVLGRHLAPAFVLVAAAATTVSARWTRALWWTAAVGGWVFSLPMGWGEPDLAGLATLIVPILAGGALAVLVAWAGYRGTRSLAFASAIGAFVLAVPVQAVVADARPPTRWVAWNAAAAFDPIYDLHFLDGAAMSAWPAWKFLDAGGYTIAVSAGYSEGGQAWYLYPLLGSELSNRVIYVPPTADGTVPDERDIATAMLRLDRDAWIRRLRAANVDFVMCLWPPSLECSLLTPSTSPVFQTVGALEAAGWSLHRFHREAVPVSSEAP